MKNMDIIDRTAEGKEKNGINTGWHVINPINNEKSNYGLEIMFL